MDLFGFAVGLTLLLLVRGCVISKCSTVGSDSWVSEGCL